MLDENIEQNTFIYFFERTYTHIWRSCNHINYYTLLAIHKPTPKKHNRKKINGNERKKLMNENTE